MRKVKSVNEECSAVEISTKNIENYSDVSNIDEKHGDDKTMFRNKELYD